MTPAQATLVIWGGGALGISVILFLWWLAGKVRR